MQQLPTCLYPSFLRCRNGCYWVGTRCNYRPPAFIPASSGATSATTSELSPLLPTPTSWNCGRSLISCPAFLFATGTHQLQLRPLAHLLSSFRLCYQHLFVATTAARLLLPQLSPLLPAPIKRNRGRSLLLSPQLSALLPAPIRRYCGRSLLLCRLQLGHG